MARNDTKTRILDAAESLFAENGFHNTSLRAITARAGVNLAAVNYHFGSKNALVEAVFQRRLNPLNEVRLRNLAEVRESAAAAGTPPAVEDILRAFLEPTLRFRDSGAGASHFLTLVGRTLFEPHEEMRGTFLRLVRPVFLTMVDLLGQALPQVAPETLQLRMQMALGAMAGMICMPKDSTLISEGVTLDRDTDTTLDVLLAFIAAGLRAP